VTFSVLSGTAQLGGCGSTCIVLTDATGLASMAVTATAFGAITVQAAAVGAVQSSTFVAVARNVTVLQPVEYVAPGATVAWIPQVSVVENGAPAVGVPVQWTGSAGLAVSAATSLANQQGIGLMPATAGPLAAGTQATGQGCAWNSVCASFAAVGVDSSAWRLVVMEGSGQSVASSATFAPLVVMVTDTGGNPVAGASVAIYQAASAAEMTCPARGRCPVMPLLATSTAAAISDANGLVSVIPMQLPAIGEVTNVAVAAGSQAFVPLSLTQQP
jgi:hypothetical protein